MIVAPARDAAVDLGRVVCFHEHRQSERRGQPVQILEQRVVGDRGRDEQDRIGADRPRLEHLHVVDREVLPQDRAATSPPGLR